MKNAVAIAGYYGFDNAGDELILLALLRALRAEGAERHVIVFSRDPNETRRRFDVDAVNRWHPWSWIRPLTEAEQFILGGGGLLQESTGPWNHFYYLVLVVLAKAFGCRTELKALGVDPIHSLFNRWWTRWVIRHAVDALSVRDQDSKEALEELGIRRPVKLEPDLVFQLKPSLTPTSPDFRRVAGRLGDLSLEGRGASTRQAASAGRVAESKGEGCCSHVALAISPWPARPGWPHDLASLADRIHRELSVPVDLLLLFPREDEAISRNVAARTAHPVRVRSWTRPEELLLWMGDYALVAGMRYHALVLASLAGKAFVGWGSHKKVESICRDFRAPFWSFEWGWDVDAVFRQIDKAWRQRDRPQALANLVYSPRTV